jgi:tRNA(Glu) U13 pseudouridine synthase TruD
VEAENDKTIEDAATSFGKSGFINYFGLQVE